MTKTVGAVFDGRALWPEEPIDIKPDTRVTLTIEVAEKKSAGKAAGRSFLEAALSLKLDGPRDGSRRSKRYRTANGHD